MVLLGVQYIGAISVPIDKKALESNIADIYKLINPAILFTDSKISDDTVNRYSLKGIYHEVLDEGYTKEMDEMAYVLPDTEAVSEILFTTGTTGVPKGAMLTYKNVYASTHNTWNGVGMRTSDTVLIPLPLNHSVGMRVLRTALYIGATVVMQNGFTFAKELENNILEYDCTALVCVPASIDIIMGQMQDRFVDIVGKLRYIEFGAGSLSYDMKKKLTRLLPHTTIYNTWGSTETGGAIFLNVSERPDKYQSLGKPMDGIELKVIGEDGQEVAAKEIDTAGRMVLRGDMQMAGYYNLPEENEKTLVDGWLYTNDLVYRDEEGYVYMLGRADSIINVGGEKVSPIEVENIATEYECIKECGCIGVPDDMLGQVPVFFVVVNDGYREEELKKYLSVNMEAYKIPAKYIVIDELPRNRMQKLDYKALRQIWIDGGQSDLYNPVIRNIYGRHSVREFTEDKIPYAILEMIVKAGMYAPSGHNMQTWKFTVIDNVDVIQNVKSVVQRVAKEKNVYCYGFNNPVTLVLISNDRRNDNCIQDSSCAAENIMLAANSYGIGSVWLNTLKTLSDEPEVRELLDSFDIPTTHIVWSMIALGYPAKNPNPPKKKMNVVKWID